MRPGRYSPRMCNGFTLVFRDTLPTGHFEYIRYDMRKPEVRGFLHRARKSGRKRNNQIINRAGKNPAEYDLQPLGGRHNLPNQGNGLGVAAHIIVKSGALHQAVG